MALITPDYLQTKTYAAKRDRRVNQAAVMQEGIVNFGDFKATQRGAGANMSVDIAAGEAWVDGDASVDQGFYHVVNDATVNVAISNNASGNPRIDTIVLKVNDSADAGSGTDTPAIEVVTGTPTAAATLSNLNGIAALPATALRLGYVLVANGAVKIENAQIGNLRDPRAGTTGYPAVAEPKAISGAPAQYAHGRPFGYVPSLWAKRTSGQAIANSTQTILEFNLEEYDNDEMHSTSSETSKLFAKTPGLYAVAARIEYAVNTTVYATISGSVAGVATSYVGIRTSDNTTGASDAGIRLGYNDYIQISGQQVSGGASTFQGHVRMIWQGP